MLAFVGVAATSFFKTVDWGQVNLTLHQQSPRTLLLLTLGGIIAVIPMLGYDFTLNRLLQANYHPSYLIRCGWMTNTLTNIAGFGGILGSSLRALFYHEAGDRKTIIAAVAKLALFLSTGLSVICWLALGIICFNPVSGHLMRYGIWIIAGGLYAPLLIWWTRRHSQTLFNGLTPRLEAFVVVSSILEWLGVTLFFVATGALLQIQVNLLAVIPLYIVAQIIGVLSMIPGALGSFDVIMMFELVNLGVPRTSVIVWLLMFRVFYYVVPLLLGGLLGLHQAWVGLNQALNQIPRQSMRQLSYLLGTILMYSTGLMMLLAAIIPNLTDSNQFLARFYPLTFFILHQLSTIMFAIILLACARGISSRVAKAYWPTMIVLGVASLNAYFNLASPSVTLSTWVIMFLVWKMRPVLYRKKLQYTLGKFTIDAVIFAGSMLVYMLVGYLNSPKYQIKHTTPNYLLFPGGHIWASGFIGMLIGLILMTIMIRFLMHANEPFRGSYQLDLPRFQALINRFGGNETSHLALLNDKRIYYYQVAGQDQVALMYRVKYDKLIVMGNPIGNQTVVAEALHAFTSEADIYGYLPVFYEVSGPVTMQLHELGFDFLKIGEDGLVTLADFTLAGKKQRSQRALIHKFEREGYTFTMVEPPFEAELMHELKAVSDDWLHGQIEKGFSLGFFDDDYINAAPVGIVRSASGELVAFVTLMPTGGKELLTIDLMRHSHTAPSGIMDLLFVRMFEYGQDHGYPEFDLGMAPLANVGESNFSFITERIAHFIYQYGTRLYGFQGLRRYKEKYVSHWKSRYLVYRKKHSLVATMIALVQVVNERRK